MKATETERERERIKMPQERIIVTLHSVDKNDQFKINLMNDPINLYQCVIDFLMIKYGHR